MRASLARESLLMLLVVGSGGCHRGDTRANGDAWLDGVDRCIESVRVDRFPRELALIGSLKPLAAWAVRSVDPEITRTFRDLPRLDYDESVGNEVASFRELIGETRLLRRDTLGCEGDERQLLIDVLGDKLEAASGGSDNTALTARYSTLGLDSFESRLAMEFAVVLEMRGQPWTEAGLARVVQVGRPR